MEILIQPTIDTLCEDLDYDEYEDSNVDALLFKQGYESCPIEVMNGDSFEIPEGFIGRIADDENSYFMIVEIAEGIWEKVEILDELEAGYYCLNNDIISVKSFDLN